MKKYMKKGMSIFLTLSMTVCMLAGCGSSDANKTSDNNSKKAQSTTVNTAQVEQLLTNKLSVKEDADNDISDESTDNSSSGQADKKETVYVEMKADGQVLKTTVSDVLKSTDNATIEDISDLEDITNLSGDEKFTKTGDTNISWENKGEDITYQGTTTKEAPISIQVKYYLDDEEISADDLAGKSGSVKIVYK
jgi:putative membrane protein